MARDRQLDPPESGLNATLATNTFISGSSVTSGKRLLLKQVMVSCDAAVGTLVTINEEDSGGVGIRFYWENTSVMPIPMPGDGWLLTTSKNIQGKHESGIAQKFTISSFGVEVDP